MRRRRRSRSGARPVTSTRPGPYLVVDIGGGSTEFVVGTTEPTGLVSVDIGCVRITEQFLHSDPPAPEELSQAVSVVRDHLADVKRTIPGIADARDGRSGSPGRSRPSPRSSSVSRPTTRSGSTTSVSTREAVEDVFRTLATEPAAQRRHNPGLEAERVDVIVGGAVVLASVMRAFEHQGDARLRGRHPRRAGPQSDSCEKPLIAGRLRSEQ